jgi:hypothetical protein
VVGLIAHVRRVERVGVVQDSRERGKLALRRRNRRRIPETTRHADGTRIEGGREFPTHGRNLALTRGAIEIIHGTDAERGMADETGGIHRRGPSLERIEIISETAEASALPVRDEIQRRRQVAGGKRREAHAAIAGDHRGDLLARLRRQPGDIDLLPPAARGERADRGNAVAIESYIGADGGGTGAVEYTAAAQHKVVARHGTKP